MMNIVQNNPLSKEDEVSERRGRITKQCQQCSKTFMVPPDDQEFYARLNVPVPTLCSDCRCQRRMATRNERNFYPDHCDACGKQLISLYSADKNLTVYCHECWWNDNWSGLQYGQNIDFNRSFFEQFQELQRNVPRANVLKAGGNIVNSDYCSYVGAAKNCYLVAGSIHVEDCLYGNPYYSKQCVDSLLIRDCELCYECITSENLYNCAWCQDCSNSRDLLYCYDLRNCSDCIGCVGLRNKQYCIFNKQYTKAEYKKEQARIDLNDPEKMQRAVKHFTIQKLKIPRKFLYGVHNEDVTGNYINDSKSCSYCFDIKRCDNVKYSAQVIDLKDCYDNNYTEENEMCVDYIGSWKNNRCYYSNTVYNSSEIWYSELCYSSKNLFGCAGLRNAEYCILNKQFTKQEYETLLPKIIAHMSAFGGKKTGEWGEFFPIERSVFAYNETVAYDYFPASKETIVANGWEWITPKEIKGRQQRYRVPRDINKVKSDICDALLVCQNCLKNYKVTAQELAFYKTQQYPIPKNCPDCRHSSRMKQRTTRALWQRQCMCTRPPSARLSGMGSAQLDHNHETRCPQEFTTAYNPATREIVYCQKCYERII